MCCHCADLFTDLLLLFHIPGACMSISSLVDTRLLNSMTSDRVNTIMDQIDPICKDYSRILARQFLVCRKFGLFMENRPLLSISNRTIIITGAYGSGKTECAMALAMTQAAFAPVTLVDLDFVNPYFRSQDHRDTLEAAGVRVVAPDPEVAPIDAPAMPPEAREVMLRPNGLTLVDLGGDPAGAIVIG
jgi:hypothetical protein